MKEKMKQRKGITLISLVITIVVLLILAGITINLTIGKDGIIRKAQEGGETYKNAEANELADIASFEASVIPGKVAKIVDGVQYVGDGMGNLIPVPVGFSYLEGTESTGFVIKNDTDGNEFVWVLCTIDGANESIKYDRNAFLSSQPADGTDEVTNSTKIKYSSSTDYVFIEAMPSDEEASIRTYGGFYIGRYESGVTGYDVIVSTSNDSKLTEWTGYTNGTLVVKSGQQVWNYITRDKAKKVSEELYSKTKGDSVNSKLCSSYAWDTALKFIETKNRGYATNSTGGNYKNQTFSYTDLNGATQTKAENSTTLVPTGQTTAVNNIYDMGGNVREWITEACRDERYTYTSRGGGCNYASSGGPAAHRDYGGSAYALDYISFRITLYL